MAENIPKPFEAYKGEETFVFVSYAHDDSEEVYRDIKRLHEAGYRIWYDEGVTPGEEFLPEILDAIKRCSYVIAFLSPSALASYWVSREMEFARNRQKQVIPIHLQETNLTDELEFHYRGKLAIYKQDLRRSRESPIVL